MGLEPETVFLADVRMLHYHTPFYHTASSKYQLQDFLCELDLQIFTHNSQPIDCCLSFVYMVCRQDSLSVSPALLVASEWFIAVFVTHVSGFKPSTTQPLTHTLTPVECKREAEVRLGRLKYKQFNNWEKVK